MIDWDVLMGEAEGLARQFKQDDLDLAEAVRVGDYFLSKNYDQGALWRYLQVLCENPPPRSKRSQRHFRNMKKIWEGWRSSLSPKDQARAWLWAVRRARSRS